ncbi:nuclear envelope protein [Blastomyces dermatitidis ATCC 18188]|uniref:Nuclear envelope protein n=1 Tax=Ajellomyces dermatitidis (strain ATCC 18188 / CBS 674.68) TaxID=653446 RepID=F2T7H1_AJEDA|nr:nuclear envelope protein [Blastomyces dermatitidis ATCC 18188]
MATTPSRAPAARPRQYRRILTSTLHRKFVHASAVSLVACYVVAFFIGVKSSFFWSWFPLGACGFRTLLLFISCLAIFILRVGQMHVGARTTSSAFSSTRQALFSFSTFQTFGWYLVSAWWFSEVYMWSSSESAELNWVKPGRPYERAKLNERPIYLHCFYALLAITQSIFHLYFDWDKIHIPVSKRSANSANHSTHELEPLPVRIRKAVPQVLYDAVIRSSVTAVVGPFIYMLFLRRIAWSWVLSFAKLFWNFPRSAADPPGLIPPLHILLILRAATSGVLLVTLWQVSNLLFSTFLGQAPLKKGQPLTNESKDPNGSLLNGLKAKRDVVRTFAFWELCLIGQQFPERRKAIFADIDRNGGSAWTQILGASTNVIKGITARINEHQNPTTLPAADSSTVSGKTSDSSNMDGQPTTIHTLPRLTSAPKGDNIFLASSKPTTRPEQFESAFGSVAKSYGQSPNWTPAARNQARNIFNRATTAVLSPEQRKRISASAQELKLLTCSSSSSSSSGRPRTHPLIHQFLSSLAGLPFRRSYARRLRIIILGKPYASLSPIIDAVESLTRLLIASMAEDQFGKVQADIAAVVRLFTETAMALESFTGAGEGGLDVHWTDVDFPPADAEMEIQKKARRVEEVEMIKEALKGGLAELLEAFKLYLDDVGIRGKELRMAREAAGLV